MAYNLYQVQQAEAWKQRINKEVASAELFWTTQALESSGRSSPRNAHGTGHSWETGSTASRQSSAAPTGYTSKTSFLKSRLDRLEVELLAEREQRLRVQADLDMLRASSQGLSPRSATHSPRPN